MNAWNSTRRYAAIWIVALLAGIAFIGCSPDFEDQKCETEQDCFPGEICTEDGLCVLETGPSDDAGADAISDAGPDATSDAGPDAGPDADQDITEDATPDGESDGETPAEIASVEVTPASADVALDLSIQLTATALDANGDPIEGELFDWSTSDDTIASVDENGEVTGNALGEATITATSQTDPLLFAESVITVVVGEVARVEVTPASSVISVGSTVQLQAQAYDANDNLIEGAQFVWSLPAETTIISVDPEPDPDSDKALVTAEVYDADNDTVTVTANAEGVDGTATVQVRQVPVASVTVETADPTDDLSIEEGQTLQLVAKAFDADGNELTGRDASWSSADSNIASVDSATGLVTGENAGGPVAITADIDGETASVDVTVTAAQTPTVTSIVITAPGGDFTVDELDSIQLTATAYDANGNPMTGQTFTWTSSDEDVAYYGVDGLFFTKQFGTATITASIGSVSDSKEITVNKIPATDIVIETGAGTTDFTVEENATLQLVANPYSGANPLFGRTATWSSANTNIATVDPNSGEVTGVAAGTVDITADIDGVTKAIALTVTEAQGAAVDHITITAPGGDFTVDEFDSLQLTATAYDANGDPMTGQTFTWSSDDTDVIFHGANGLFFTKQFGTATITAAIGSVSDSKTVTVNKIAVDDIVIETGAGTTDFTVEENATLQLVATPYSGANPLFGRTATWSSADTNIATVDPNSGEVTGVAAGTVDITADVDGFTKAITLTVTTATPASDQLIISEYVEGSSSEKAIEIYNPGTTTIDLSQYYYCTGQNGQNPITQGCNSKFPLSDVQNQLTPGELFVVCSNQASTAVTDLCQHATSIVQHNGNDIIMLFKDENADGTFTDADDTIMDIFGTPGESNSLWKDNTYDRCDFTPYLGVGNFVVLDYYTELPKDTFTGLGVAPTEGCAP